MRHTHTSSTPRGAGFAVALILFLLVIPASAIPTHAAPAPRVQTGWYFGNGSSSRAITGLGFQPDLVIVTGSVFNPSVARTASMAGNVSKPLGTNAGLQSNEIISLDSGGFTVGSGGSVNAPFGLYYWIAFQAVAGQMRVGSYSGNGNDNRDITGLGFEPDYLIVMSSGNDEPMQRFRDQSVDASLQFSADSERPDRIQDFRSDGFQVGRHDTVNKSGRTYYYAAWKEKQGMSTGTYVGNGINDTPVHTPGFRPGYLLIRAGVDGADAVHRPEAMSGTRSLPVPGGVSFSSGIKSFLELGFTLGTHQSVNTAGDTYYYAAFSDNSGLDLALSLSDSLLHPNPGDTVSVRVTLRNLGSVEANGLEVTGLLPAGLSFISALPARGSYADGTGLWSVGTLAAGDSTSLGLRARVTTSVAGATLVFTASLTGLAASQVDANPANDSATLRLILPSADLSVSKTVNRTTPTVGDTLTYTVALENMGPDGADSVRVRDLLPPGITFVSATPAVGGYVAATGLWSVGSLTNGASTTLTLRGTVDAGFGGLTIRNEATIEHAEQADPDTLNNRSAASVGAQSADLGVSQSVDDATPNEGQTVQIFIALANDGPSTATQVRIRALLPAGLSFVSATPSNGSYSSASGLWDIPVLATDPTATLQVSALVLPGTAGTQLSNSVNIESADQADPVGSNNSSTLLLQVSAADLVVSQSANPAVASVSETALLTLTVRNDGPSEATGVSLQEVLSPGLVYLAGTPSQGSYTPATGAWDVGTLPTGGSATLGLTVQVAPGTGGQSLISTASVVGVDQTDLVPGNNSAAATIVVPSADLGVGLTVGPVRPAEGDTLTWQVRATNYGPDAASGAVVRVTLPTLVSPVDATAGQGSYDPTAGLWTVGTLSDSSGATLDVRTRVAPGAAGTTLTASAAVTALTQADPVVANDQATTGISVPLVDVALQKSLPVATANEGDTLTYSVRLVNAGSDTATALRVTDTLPTGLSFVLAGATTGIYSPGSGLWTVPSVAPNSTATLTLEARVLAGTGGTTIANTATLDAVNETDRTSADNSASVNVTIQRADLALGMTVNDATPDVGTPLSYSVTLTNNGPDAANGIVVSVTRAAGLTLTGSSAGQGSYSGITSLWTVGSLAAGGSTTLTLNATPAPGTAGASLSCTATIQAVREADHVVGNNSASRTVFVQATLGATAATLPGGPRAPGSAAEEVFRLTLENVSATAETLQAVSFTNVSIGPGTTAERDAEWRAPELGLAVNAGSEGTPRPSTFVSGRVTFGSLGAVIPPGGTLDLVLRAGVASVAHDGDALAVQVTDAAALTFSRSLTVGGAWPLTSGGALLVDGMVAAQIARTPIPAIPAPRGMLNLPALNVVVPANGYRPDTLTAVRLQNLGTARAGDDLGALRLWRDGGNGTPDAGAGDDQLLGVAAPAGSGWELAGLSRQVLVGGMRLFATVDVAAGAGVGRTIRLALPAAPDDGLVMQSANDGPRDAAVSDPGTMSIVADPNAVVRVVASATASGTLLPVGAAREVFRIQLSNASAFPETLTALTLTNRTVGPGSAAERDVEWGPLTLGDSGALTGSGASSATTNPQDATAAGLVTASMSGGAVRFTGFRLPLAPGQSAELSVTAGAARVARDGDRLDVRVEGAGDVGFSRTVPLEAAWPLDPAGDFVVDGMTAAQILVRPVAADLIRIGSPPRLVLDFVVPANGYAADVLNSLLLENLGSADGVSDVSRLELWRAGSDGRFDAGDTDDRSLGVATWNGSGWRFDGLAEPIGVGGLRVYVAVGLKTDARVGRTIQLALPGPPKTAITVASSNDGPIDGGVANPEALTIADNPGETIIVGADVQTSRTLLPGGPPVTVLLLRFLNYSSNPETLEAVTLRNVSSGPGTTEQLDAEWTLPTLAGQEAAAVPETREPSAAFSGGLFTLSGLRIILPPGREVVVPIEAGASLSARDGDLLDLQVEGPGSFTLTRPVSLSAAWPLSPAGFFTVDGMAADQIVLRPVPSGNALTGERRALALDLLLPPNGYVSDQLQRLDLLNLGSARSGSDIARMELWLDDGDGEFSPESDSWRGEFRDTGARWEITGLSERVPLGGLRVFVTVDVANLATEGRSLRLALPALPDPGVGMASGNDGPLDRMVENPNARSIANADRISVRSESRPTGVAAPGQRDVLLLDLGATNTYGVSQSLVSLAVRNSSSGSGTPEQLDREFETLKLYADDDGSGTFDGGSGDRLLGTTAFSDGRALFTGLDWRLNAAASGRLFVVAEVSRTSASDGDLLNVTLAESFDLDFGSAVAVVADWPLTGGGWRVDGFVRDQIGGFPVEAATIGPGGSALALDFSLPSNGYRPDNLSWLRLVNRGTAQPSDLGDLRLWRDGGDGIFSTGGGDDTDLGSLVPLGDGWQTPNLGASIPAGGARFFAVITAAPAPRDSVTVRLALPVGGVEMVSLNDGPLDFEVAATQSVLISSAPLLASLNIAPRVSTVGQLVTVQMSVENRSGEALTGVRPSELNLDGEGLLTRVAGPTPPTIDLAAGAAGTFAWQYEAAAAGEVRLVGHAGGIGSPSGVLRESIPVASNSHRVFIEANELEVFPVESPGFSVTPGQVGVIPLSLTFRNPGSEAGSDIRVTGLRLRVEDDLGGAIAPASVFNRVTVSEGNRIYQVKAAPAIEATGAEIDLTLALPVLVTRLEPVSLNLQFSMNENVTVPEFRVTVETDDWILASDVTSGAPVAIRLRDRVFPIRSGLGQFVSEARELAISGAPADPLRVGPGQPDVPLLRFRLDSPGVSGVTSDIRLSALGLILTDEAGQLIAEPDRYLQQVRVQAGQISYPASTVPPENDGAWQLNLTPPLVLAANTPLEVLVSGRIADTAPPGRLQLRLAEDSRIDARDARTRRSVAVVRAAGAGTGAVATIERPASQLDAVGTPLLPGIVTVGQRNVPALRGTLSHPGTPGTARIRIDGLTVQCRNQQLELQAPGALINRLRVLWDGTEVASLTNLSETAGVVTLPLPGLLLEPGAAASLELRIDVSPTAPLAYLQLMVDAEGFAALDANTLLPVTVTGSGAGGPLLLSGLSQLQPPAREAIVSLESLMPAALVADGQETVAGRISISNSALAGSGAIRLDHLRLRAADGRGQPVPVGQAARIFVTGGATKIGESGLLTADSTGAWISFPEPVVIPPGETARLDLGVVFDTPTQSKGYRLGIDREGIGVIQPGGALLTVEVRTASGAAFPLWTEAGNFSPTTLRDSYANFPNPFAAGRENTSFVYYLPGSARVTLEIWSAGGDRVVTLLDAEPRAGGLHQEDSWDGRNGRGLTVVNGVYLAALRVVFDDGRSESLLRKVAVTR